MKMKIKTTLNWISKAFHKSFNTFCSHTYIHAFQFFSKELHPSIKLFDKIFWTIIILAMLLWAAFGCDLFLYRSNENAMKNYIITDYMPIGSVPFPAITLCPTQKISSSNLDIIIQNHKLNGLNLTLLRKSLNYFDFNAFKYIPPIRDEEINVITAFKNATKLDTLQLMKRMSYNCDELLVKCRWEGIITNCENLFKMSRSYEGFCCSFNYNDDHGLKPVHTNYFGVQNGLTFAFNIPNSGYPSAMYGAAAKILIHKPHSYASFMVPQVLIPFNTETTVYLKPQMTIANDEVKSLPVTSRNCYLRNETNLEYFKVYSHKNCVAECTMNQIYEFCSCVPHFFPTSKNLSVCDETKIKCLHQNLDEILHVKSNEGHVDGCHCLLTCNKLIYPYNLQTTTFISPKYTFHPFYTGLNQSHTVVHVAMAKQTMRLLNTELSMNWIQLIANIGGIVSLFTGVSIVSLTHLIYFATVKWILYIYDEYKLSKIDKRRVRFSKRLTNLKKF